MHRADPLFGLVTVACCWTAIATFAATEGPGSAAHQDRSQNGSVSSAMVFVIQQTMVRMEEGQPRTVEILLVGLDAEKAAAEAGVRQYPATGVRVLTGTGEVLEESGKCSLRSFKPTDRADSRLIAGPFLLEKTSLQKLRQAVVVFVGQDKGEVCRIDGKDIQRFYEVQTLPDRTRVHAPFPGRRADE